MSATESELTDRALLGEVDLARAAAQEEAVDEVVGEHVGAQVEGETAVTHLFEAAKPGYHGWRWAVTVASGGPDTDVTVSEVVLLPGPDALVAPEWVPWENRVKAGDLGVGDLMPTAPDDPRLVPAYLASDDPAVEELAREVGLGRPRVMARPARLEAAARWQHSEFGPRSDMARSAPAHCGTCGFYLPLAGSLRAAFGTCGNEISPADGHVVHAEYGCGAHSEAEVEQVSPVLVANLIYDDAQLDVALLPQEAPEETPAAEALAEAAATEAPTAEAPTAEAPTAEAPTAEAPPAETLIEASAAEAPVAEAPVAEASAAEAPPAEAPVAEAPAAEAPASEPPALEAPVEALAAATPAPEAPSSDASVEAPAAELSAPQASMEAPAEAVTESSAAESVPSPAQPGEEVAPATSVWTEPPTQPDAPAEQPAPASNVWTEPPTQPAEQPVPASSVWTEPPAEPEAPVEEAAPAGSVWTEPVSDESTRPEDTAELDLATAPDHATAPDQATDPAQPDESRPEDPAANTDTNTDAVPSAVPSADPDADPSTDQPQLFDDESYKKRRPWIGQRWFKE